MVTITQGADARERKKVSKWSQPSEIVVMRRTARVIHNDQNCKKHLRFSRIPSLLFTVLGTIFMRISTVMSQRQGRFHHSRTVLASLRMRIVYNSSANHHADARENSFYSRENSNGRHENLKCFSHFWSLCVVLLITFVALGGDHSDACFSIHACQHRDSQWPATFCSLRVQRKIATFCIAVMAS